MRHPSLVVLTCVPVLLAASFLTAQTTPPGMLPYVAIAHPEFVPAADATFLVDDDILIGVARGTVAKAYPAADLAQHGSVDDEMADGPIEVTWCGVCRQVISNTSAARTNKSSSTVIESRLTRFATR